MGTSMGSYNAWMCMHMLLGSIHYLPVGAGESAWALGDRRDGLSKGNEREKDASYSYIVAAKQSFFRKV
jgi:hypothetical protein